MSDRVSHRARVVIEGEVDLYEYDDMDRGDITDEAVKAWQGMCKADIEDSLTGTLDRVDKVTFFNSDPGEPEGVRPVPEGSP